MTIKNIVVFVMACSFFAAIPGYAVPELNHTARTCVGSNIHVSLAAVSGCSGMKVMSQSDWTISPTPSSITYNGSSGAWNSIDIVYNSTASVSISVSYYCSISGPGDEETTSFSVVSPVTPSVSLSLSNNAICRGVTSESITFTGTPTNGGSAPSYIFSVDGTSVNTQSPTAYTSPVTYTYSASSLSPGTHTVVATMLNTTDCVTTSTVTDTKTFTISTASVASGISGSTGAVCGSGSVSISLSSLVASTATWYYRYSDDGGTTYTGWTAFAMSTSSPQSLSVTTNGSFDRKYLVYVAAQNGSCAVVSSGQWPIDVSVNNPGTISPGGLIESYGTASGVVSLSVSVGTIQTWQQSSNGTTWTNISGTANAFAYNYSGVNPISDVYYRTLLDHGVCSSLPSTPVHLTVYNAVGIKINNNVVTQYGLPFGGKVKLVSQNTHSSYQWMKDGVDLAGKTTNELPINVPGVYQLRVKATSTATPGIATVTVSPLGTQNDPNYNVVATTVIRKPGVTSSTNIYTTLDSTQYRQSVTYSDGLKTLSSIAIGQSPMGHDVVTPFGYDSLFAVSYLPYIDGNIKDGQRKIKALSGTGGYSGSDQYGFYQQTNAKIDPSTAPYAKALIENSPLGRVTEQGAPGTDWQPGGSHTIKPEFHVNGTSDVMLWTSTSPFSPAGYYTAGTLALSQVNDENGNIVKTFSDKFGRTILKRVQSGVKNVSGDTIVWLNTYYVYDDRGNVAMQVPPKASAKAAASLWADSIRTRYCFQYTYDARNRLVQKLVPGATAPTYYVYDRLGRLVLSQDGNLRTSNKWAFVKYDAKNRPVMTGFYTDPANLATMQAAVSSLYSSPSTAYFESRGTTLEGYTNVSFPTANYNSTAIEVLTVAYYDNYDFDYDSGHSNDYNYIAQGLPGEATPVSGRTFGLPTGSKRKILGTSTWLVSAVFYDRFGRPIQSQSNNHLNAPVNNIATSVYDFEGKVMLNKVYHNAGGSKITTTLIRNEYDFAGRLIRVYHSLNGLAEVVNAYYKYNELGQLVEKNLHCKDCVDPNIGTANVYDAFITRTSYSSSEQKLVASQSVTLDPNYDTGTTGPLDALAISTTAPVPTGGGTYMQSVDYRYHLRGWLKSINNAQLTNDSGVTNDDTEDYFGLELSYNTSVSGLSNTLYYNGNISAVKWKSYGSSGAAGQRAYKYKYDLSDRLLSATFRASDGTSWNKEVGTLNEKMTYDLNGNILSLSRKRNTPDASGTAQTGVAQDMDLLKYTFDLGNVLSRVNDLGLSTSGFVDGYTQASGNVDFEYDAMGNLIRDRNKGITSITYNELGKPSMVDFGSGKYTTYTYDAAGAKLTVKNFVSSTLQTTTDYVGGFVYVNGALSFFASPEGRIVKNSNGYEYQYAIADNQGNTRVLFTTKPTPVSYLADLESSTNSDFQNYNNRVNAELWDHTDAGLSDPDYSQKLTGATNQQVGVAKSIRVHRGDKVKIEAYAKYQTSSGSSNLAGFATALLNAFGLSAPGGTETGTPSAGVNGWGGIVASGSGENNGSYPKAFVNLLIFDKNYNFVNLAYDGINGGEQTASPTKAPHDYMSAEYTATDDGFIFAYVSNENGTLVDVYFDDVKVTVTPSPIIQSNEYYPFGLQTASSWTRDGSLANNFLANGGTELNSVTGVYDLEFRNYDPMLGRMNQLDPMADSYSSVSPYNFVFNNPVMLIDADGADPRDISEQLEREHYQKLAKHINPTNGLQMWTRSGVWIPGFTGLEDGSWDDLFGNYDMSTGIPTFTPPASNDSGLKISDALDVLKYMSGEYAIILSPVTIEEARSNSNFLQERVDEFWSKFDKPEDKYANTLIAIQIYNDTKDFRWGSDTQTQGGPLQARFGFGELMASTELAIAGLKPTFDAAAYFGRLNGGVGTVPIHLKKNIFQSYTLRSNNALQIGRINSSTAIKVGNSFGKVATTFAIAGVLTTAYDIGKDGQLTAGDAFQAVNTGLMIAFPIYGVAYGLVDLGFATFSDQSLTDRIKGGIDSNVSGSISIP